MIWSKTEAGRVEMQTRALVKERSQRNLLLLIDGVKTEDVLLASVAGVARSDLEALAALGLIVGTGGGASASGASGRPAGAAASAPAAASSPAAGASPDPGDYAQFTETLTQLISSELGLRGFTLTLAVEKAGTNAELRDVAERVIRQIADRKGPEAADKARRRLYGG